LTADGWRTSLTKQKTLQEREVKEARIWKAA